MRTSLRLSGRSTRTGLAALLVTAACFAPMASAQELDPSLYVLPDSLFVTAPAEPVYYTTIYDRNRSRGAWTQTVAYTVLKRNVVLVTSAHVTRIKALQGVQTEDGDGEVSGRLDWRATHRWVWTVDGRFNTSSSFDPLSASDRKENRLQVRTQYALGPWRDWTAFANVSTEFQREHKIANRIIQRDTLAFGPGGVVGATPPWAGRRLPLHTQRDSAFATGRRDGLSGSLNWRPSQDFQLQTTALVSRIRIRQRSLLRDFWARASGESASYEERAPSVTDEPSENAHFGVRAAFRGPLGIQTTLNLRKQESDQIYFATDFRAQERFSYDNRLAAIQLIQAPFPGANILIDGSVSRSLRQYVLNRTQTALVRNANINITASHWVGPQLVSANLLLDRSETSRRLVQVQNGLTTNRHLSLRAVRRISPRLTVDATGSVSLLSRIFELPSSGRAAGVGVSQADQDDARANLNLGAGYQVSDRCSTAVHFSLNRGHSVAIHPSASGNNNVQSIYQMDAQLQLRLSPRFWIRQHYLLNASYRIHDFVQNEARNTLTRSKRIETVVVDSLFPFAVIRLNHNFDFRDFGSFSRAKPDEDRLYLVASESYVQSLDVTAGIRPAGGVLFLATQSLIVDRAHDLRFDRWSLRNRWKLTLGGEMNRRLPGGIGARGAVQRISEFTGSEIGFGVDPPQDYWQAGVTVDRAF